MRGLSGLAGSSMHQRAIRPKHGSTLCTALSVAHASTSSVTVSLCTSPLIRKLTSLAPSASTLCKSSWKEARTASSLVQHPSLAPGASTLCKSSWRPARTASSLVQAAGSWDSLGQPPAPAERAQRAGRADKPPRGRGGGSAQREGWEPQPGNSWRDRQAGQQKPQWQQRQRSGQPSTDRRSSSPRPSQEQSPSTGYQDEREAQFGGGSEAGPSRGWRGTREQWARDASSQRQNGGGPQRGWQRPSADRWGSRPDPDQPSTLTALRDSWVGSLVYGVNPVAAALKSGRRDIHALYIQEGIDAHKRKDGGAFTAAVAAARQLGTRIETASKHDLNIICDNRPHQGLVLDCSELDWAPLEELPSPQVALGAAPPIWLALDEVTDPQNLGAVLRCAHFLGAAGVLGCQRNSAPLSAAVSKASAGALEVMALHSCQNLPRTLAAAASAGWAVLGADNGPGSVSCADFQVQQPTVLVMGSEGHGLRTNVRRACSQLLRIDAFASAGSPAAGEVDSLNVSVAAGILLHHLLLSATRAS